MEPSSPACDSGSCFSVFSQNGQSCSWRDTKLVGGSVSRARAVQWEGGSHRQNGKGHSWKGKPQHKTEPCASLAFTLYFQNPVHL